MLANIPNVSVSFYKCNPSSVIVLKSLSLSCDVKLGGNKTITLHVTNRSTNKIDAKSYLSSPFVDHAFVDASSSRPRITFSCSFG